MGIHTRRDFLKLAGVAVAGLGAASRAVASPQRKDGESEGTHGEVRVLVKESADPLMKRTFTIMQDRIEQRCPARVVEAHGDADIVLAIDRQLPEDAFRLDNSRAALRIAGGSPRGVLYGVGKFLRTSGYGATFQLASRRGTSVPDGSLRGMYFGYALSQLVLPGIGNGACPVPMAS